MLEYLRNAADKPVAKFLIGVLAFSFVGWGVAEWIFGNVAGDTTLVRVGGQTVSVQQFNAQKSHELAAMPRDKQRDVYADPAAQHAFNMNVLSTLTTQRMTENRADDLGFVVTDSYIAHQIRQFPEFQQNGQFSAYLFENVLRNSGYSANDFADVLRGNTLRGMVLGAFGAPMRVPQFAANAMYNARYGVREIEYATVKFSDFKVAEPTTEQLKQFYASNPQVVPEHRTISYVLVPAEMSKPDSYDAAFTTAQHVEDDIIGGESLAAAAKKHGAKYVSLPAMSLQGKNTDSVLNDAMIANAFNMAAETESELMETKSGFVIMRVDNVVPQHNAEFETVKKNLVADWKKSEQEKQAYVRANELLVDLNKDGKLADKKSATVSRTSGAPVVVLSAAFNSPVGTNAIVPDTDAFYVLRNVREIAPKADEKRMAELRKEMATANQNNVMEDYNAFLKRKYPVKLNEKVYHRFIEK